MNIIEEILNSYNRNRFNTEQKQIFLDESKELLDNYIDERVKLLLPVVIRRLKGLQKYDCNVQYFAEEVDGIEFDPNNEDGEVVLTEHINKLIEELSALNDL